MKEPKFKVGDLVYIVNERHLNGARSNLAAFGKGKVGDVVTVKYVEWNQYIGEIVYSIGRTYVASESMLKLAEEEKGMEKYYKNFYRALIEDIDTGKQEIHIFVEDRWVDDRGFYLPTDDYGLFKVVTIYAPPEDISDYLKFDEYGEVVWQAESEQDKAKRLEKESKQAAVANMRQKIKELEEELDNL